LDIVIKYENQGEGKMSTFNKHQHDRDRFAKCEICLSSIPIEYYFSDGDEIICYECGTTYTIICKNPVKLHFAEVRYDEGDSDDKFYEEY
jgi:hypothetical protein